jgi:hypothetical protein
MIRRIVTLSSATRMFTGTVASSRGRDRVADWSSTKRKLGYAKPRRSVKDSAHLHATASALERVLRRFDADARAA